MEDPQHVYIAHSKGNSMSKKNLSMLTPLHCSFKVQEKTIAETFKTRYNQNDLYVNDQEKRRMNRNRHKIRELVNPGTSQKKRK